MSIDSLMQRDMRPQQPQRLSLQMTDTLKIQAAFRGWRQWRAMRAELLKLRLERIERERIACLKDIRHGKWKTMEGIRDDMEEESKRLESQVSLGEKLIDHLKRDNSQITEQTKKLRDHCRTLEKIFTYLNFLSMGVVRTLRLFVLLSKYSRTSSETQERATRVPQRNQVPSNGTKRSYVESQTGVPVKAENEDHAREDSQGVQVVYQ